MVARIESPSKGNWSSTFGKLKLNDKIGKFFKGVPNGDRITIRELSEMRSGLQLHRRPGSRHQHHRLQSRGLAGDR